MKQLHGAAAATVSATAADCLALLAAVEDYPRWYPDVVRRVVVLETAGSGFASRAEVTLHVAHGPIVRDFDLLMAVHVEPPAAVSLERVSRGATDREDFRVDWSLEDLGRTSISLALDATLSVPRLLPLGGIGDAIAAGFVGAAVLALESAPAS
jgi:hypothetical protein